MVSSYTALRTHIRQKYASGATKTPEGLFADIPIDKVSEEDKVCYRVEVLGKGTLFKLDKDIKVRALPTTPSAFLAAATRKGLSILKMSPRKTDFSPQAEGDIIVRDYNRGIGEYIAIDVAYEGDKAQMLFAKQTYMQSTTDPTHYRCYFRVSRERRTVSYPKYLSLLELLASHYDGSEDEWDGMPLKQVVKSILEGYTETLLQEVPHDVWA